MLALSNHGRMFVTRSQARDLIGADASVAGSPTFTLDATDVHMGPSFIGEMLVLLVKERGYERVYVRGANERHAKVARHLADAFGFGDRVEVEQPAVPAG